MPNTVLTKERFHSLLSALKVPSFLNWDFLYEMYVELFDSRAALTSENSSLGSFPIDHAQLVLYLAHEHAFGVMNNREANVKVLEGDEQYKAVLLSRTLDKYYTNEHLSYKSSTVTSRFRPEISTIALCLNFILGMLSRYKMGDPRNTLLIDMLAKGFTMAKCIVSLLTDGFETEAFSTWRTLHENECIVHVLVKYGKDVVDRYLKHLKYALAFRGALPSKEETDKTFAEIKEGMKEADLKSKDMKRYIEYGWLLAVPDVLSIPDFKLNFRDGVERVAGLRTYAKIYEMSSEIAHSSPLLIYSRKNYFFLMAILNLYESFFRLEKIFSTIYLNTVSETEKNQYIDLRKLYFGQLMSCYDNLKARLKRLAEPENQKPE